MPKPVLWAAGVVLALALLGFGGRWGAGKYMSQRAMRPVALGSTTPASVRLPFTRVAVPSGDRTLIGWWVKARPEGGRPAPAILFLHGNGASIADYVTLQQFWYRQGISSFSFDYTGFGASGGSASLASAIVDAGRVAKEFADSAGSAARKVAMGSALGATVLLQAVDSVQPHVNGIVLEGVDASVKESAVRAGLLPKLIAPVLEDIADNVAAASRVRVATLIVQSRDDQRAPFADAQRVVEALSVKASLVKHWRRGHTALLATSRVCDWAPVLAFVKAGTLPAQKIDSTDACAAAQAAADSAKAAAAAKAAAQTKRTGTKTGAKAPVRRPE